MLLRKRERTSIMFLQTPERLPSSVQSRLQPLSPQKVTNERTVFANREKEEMGDRATSSESKKHQGEGNATGTYNYVQAYATDTNHKPKPRDRSRPAEQKQTKLLLPQTKMLQVPIHDW